MWVAKWREWCRHSAVGKVDFLNLKMHSEGWVGFVCLRCLWWGRGLNKTMVYLYMCVWAYTLTLAKSLAPSPQLIRGLMASEHGELSASWLADMLLCRWGFHRVADGVQPGGREAGESVYTYICILYLHTFCDFPTCVSTTLLQDFNYIYEEIPQYYMFDYFIFWGFFPPLIWQNS